MEKPEMLGAIEVALKEAKSNWDDSRKKELDAFEARFKTITDAKEADEKAIKQLEKDLDDLNIKFQEVGKAPKAPVNFKSAFQKAMGNNKELLKAHSGIGSGSRGKVDEKFNLLEGMDQKDIDFDSFSTGLYGRLTTDYNFLPGVYQTPFAPVWLRNVLTTVPVDSKSVEYVQENLTANGEAGTADVWDGDPAIAELEAKPEVGFNFEEATANVVWIAATTRVKREMLEDVGFLSSYIPQQLVFGRRGLLVRENALITSILDANSTPYDDRKSIAVEQIYDAAFGQLRDYYFVPTTILMNHRDVVDLILNKASGSGEYDLPPGTVSFTTGQLTIGGIPVLGLPQVAPGDWYVFDKSQTYFLNRMSAEVRMFEQDRDNVIKNLITFRAEERAGALVLSDAAVIKGSASS